MWVRPWHYLTSHFDRKCYKGLVSQAKKKFSAELALGAITCMDGISTFTHIESCKPASKRLQAAGYLTIIGRILAVLAYTDLDLMYAFMI